MDWILSMVFGVCCGILVSLFFIQVSLKRIEELLTKYVGSVQEQMNKGIVRRNGKMVRVGSVHKETT